MDIRLSLITLDSRRSVTTVCQMSSTFKKTEVSVLVLLKATVKNTEVFLFLFIFNQASYIRQDTSPRELNTINLKG